MYITLTIFVELTIGFDPDTYSEREDVGTVNLNVRVLDGQPGPGTIVTVDYRLLDGTAVGEDSLCDITFTCLS
jgi:hypothetical protein